MRMFYIVRKELKCVKEDISFNLVTVLSPLLFLFAFWLMLSGGIMLPAQVYPDIVDSPFLDALAQYHAPDGTPYMTLQASATALPPTNAESNLIVVAQEPTLENGRITGRILHHLNDVNENMTKNFRNRLDGALVNYIHALRNSGNIIIAETTAYEQDIPWNAGFGASVLVFGAVLSGLLFGMLSMTGEWENKTTTLLKLSPCSTGMITTGKVVANILKCFASGLVFLIIFSLLAQILPIHIWPLSFSLLLVYGIFICIGMCIGIHIKSTLTAFLISMAIALTLWVGGGGFGPLSYFGHIASTLGMLNPVTYAIEVVRWCYFNSPVRLATHFTFLAISFAAAFSLILITYTKWVRHEEVG